MGALAFGFFARISTPIPLKAAITASWLAFLPTSSFWSSCSRCAALHLRLRVSPSIKTKFLSRRSMMTHRNPASRPAIFTHILPISMFVPPVLLYAVTVTYWRNYADTFRIEAIIVRRMHLVHSFPPYGLSGLRLLRGSLFTCAAVPRATPGRLLLQSAH